MAHVYYAACEGKMAEGEQLSTYIGLYCRFIGYLVERCVHTHNTKVIPTLLLPNPLVDMQLINEDTANGLIEINPIVNINYSRTLL